VRVCLYRNIFLFISLLVFIPRTKLCLNTEKTTKIKLEHQFKCIKFSKARFVLFLHLIFIFLGPLGKTLCLLASCQTSLTQLLALRKINQLLNFVSAKYFAILYFIGDYLHNVLLGSHSNAWWSNVCKPCARSLPRKIDN